MATQPGPVNLSVVTQDELSRSVQKLAVATPFHRLKSGFVERFLRRRERHFDHFQINVIDPDTIFQARLYNEKPWVTFEQVEIAEVQEYISQGFWAWSGDPAVSPSGGDAEKLSDSSAQQVSSAETVPTSSAGLVATALMGDGVATNQAGGDGATGLWKDSQVLMNFLTKLYAKFDAKFADFDAKINSRFLTLEQKLSDDLGATEQRIESRLHAKTVSMISDLRSGLTTDSNTGFSKLEKAIKATDDRVTSLAADHNQLVSNVSKLSDLFQAEIQSRGEDVGDETQIPSSSEAVASGVAEVAFGVTSVSATEGGQVTSRLSAPTGRVSDSNFSSTGMLPRPFLPLDVMQSTMVTDPGRKFLPSLHTPAAAAIFSLGDFTDSFGRVASVTVQERPVAGLSVAPQAVARQPATRQSEAARAVEGRSQICNTGVTSAYGHVVNGIYRPYDNANGAQVVADIVQPVSNMSNMWQPGFSASAILPPVSNVNSVGQSVSNMSTILNPVSNVGQTFSNFSQPATSFWQPVSNYSNVTGDFSQLGTTRNSSSRVKEPSRLMPTFDPKTTNWTTFIQDFEDLVVEMGWHGQEISKLKLCFSGTVKEFFRALPLECQNNYQLLKKRFGAIFGTADEQQSSALKLYNIQQESDQDLHTFVAQIMILASKAFPNNAAMADLMARQAFWKGCKHQTEARMVISMNRCSSLDEAVDEVRRLLENYSILDGNKDNLKVRAFSKSDRSSGLRNDEKFSRRSPDRSRRNFSPANSPPRYPNSPSSPSKSALSELTEQFKLMRGDFVRFDGKLVTFGEKFTDMDNKISTMNNQVNNKIVDMDSRLTVLQDNVAEIKADVLRTKSVINGNTSPNFKSPPRRQGSGSPLHSDFSRSPVSKDKGSPRLCFRCQQPGHFVRECPNPVSPGRADRDRSWRSPSPSGSGSPSRRVSFQEPRSGKSGNV